MNRSRSVGTLVRHDGGNPFLDPKDPHYGIRAEGPSDPSTPSPPRIPHSQMEAADLRGTAAWLLNRRHGKSLRGAKDAPPPAQALRSPRRTTQLRGSLMAPPSFAGPAMQTQKGDSNLMLDTDDAASTSALMPPAEDSNVVPLASALPPPTEEEPETSSTTNAIPSAPPPPADVLPRIWTA